MLELQGRNTPKPPVVVEGYGEWSCYTLFLLRILSEVSVTEAITLYKLIRRGVKEVVATWRSG